MANTEETGFFDVYKLELLMREKLNELHWKKESLDEAQKELTETRRSLYETQALLEDQRRETNQLKMQLNSALESVTRLEDDKTKSQAYNVRIKTNCETAEMERDILVNQARTAKLENMDLKIKIQELTANIATGKMINETLEATLIELNNSVAKLQIITSSHVGKLEREQEKLRETFASSVKFSQRIQANIENSRVARECDKKKITELQRQIDALKVREFTAPAVVSTERMDLGTLHLQVDTTLGDLRRKLENNSLEDKISLLCKELREADERADKH